MRRRAFAVGTLAAACTVAAEETASQARLRQLLQPRTAPSAVTPERLREREALLTQAELLLSRLEVAEALARFEQAALILHAADTEMGIVRCYMQSGDYRRALAFGAHTAGAHLDVVGGTALYAWLLHLGGQEAVAAQLLATALARSPEQPLLSQVKGELAKPWPHTAAPLLQAPVRLAPYAGSEPARARVVSAATLVRQGRFALVPSAALKPGARYWVRNGLGATVAARPTQRGPRRAGLAELELASALPAPDNGVAPASPFPGSMGIAFGYQAQPDAGPSWPMLKAGFVGAATQVAGERRLGIGLPADARGGPVLDAWGRLTGVSLAGPQGGLLASVAPLFAAPGAAAPAPDGPAPRPSVDAMYEIGLKQALQLLRS